VLTGAKAEAAATREAARMYFMVILLEYENWKRTKF
jgi:hypothetical protein